MNSNTYKGLNAAQVEASRREHGSNVLTPPVKESLWKRFFQTLTGPFGHFVPGWQDGDLLVFILEMAAVLSLLISLSEYNGWCGLPVSPDGARVFFEPAGIVIAILLASGVGFIAEVKAEREFEVLNQINDEEPVKVIRDGHATEIPRSEVVVGDIIMVGVGEEVPADAELLESAHLGVDESSLTGEPMAHKTVRGQMEMVEGEETTFPAYNIYRGTKVMEGHAYAKVFAVGDNTENGKVFTAAKIDDGKKTPLSEQFDRLGIIITTISAVVGVMVFVGRVVMYLHQDGFPDSDEWGEVLAYILQSLMVAVTLVVCAVPEGLPMAVTMSLAYSMRRMLKTNNLVRKMHACETMGATTVICTDKTGTLTQNRMQVTDILYAEEDERLLYLNMAVNSIALLDGDDVLGSPTEGALLLWLRDRGQDYEALRRSVRIVGEEPFSTETKYMAVTLDDGTRLVKGAPEMVMAMCQDGVSDRQAIDSKLAEWQSKAMRTLAFAAFDADGRLMGHGVSAAAIMDPVRADVPEAVRVCQNAGIRIIMVTGDNYNTAREIGRQIGLKDLDSDIIARARPMDKRELVESLQRQGEVVAVTGDGTNDAPALKKADVGLSMGSGTSVAKEASDITIVDDSFSSIGKAVMWGRSLYINIQRFILFQLTVNITACLVVMIGSFMTADPPLTVTQMLWVNLIMDTFAAVALSSLPPSESVMNHMPRDRKANIIDRGMAMDLFGTGLYFTVIMLVLLWVFGSMNGTEKGMFFTMFIMLQFWNLFSTKGFRANGEPLLGGGKAFWFIAAVIFFGQLLIVSVAYNFFNISPVDADLMAIVIAFSAVAVLVKVLFRRFVRW